VQESGGDHAVVRGPNTVPDIVNLRGKDCQSRTLTDDKVEVVHGKSQKDAEQRETALRGFVRVGWLLSSMIRGDYKVPTYHKVTLGSLQLI
jgi:hypothetical protein